MNCSYHWTLQWSHPTMLAVLAPSPGSDLRNQTSPSQGLVSLLRNPQPACFGSLIKEWADYNRKHQYSIGTYPSSEVKCIDQLGLDRFIGHCQHCKVPCRMENINGLFIIYRWSCIPIIEACQLFGRALNTERLLRIPPPQLNSHWRKTSKGRG